MQLSTFGAKLTAHSGIVALMEDLGRALATPGEKYMFGGGNPAPIPMMQQILRREMQNMLANGDEFEHIIGDYDAPQGNQRFITALVHLLNKRYHWGITASNVAITSGSQTGFFILFNMLAGEMPDGQRGKVFFPLTPEYIGYTNQALSEEMFLAHKPRIEELDDHTFKYRVDFSTLHITPDIRAICISRPTNPTGNVITNDELRQLSDFAKAHDIPLITDNAYGAPFPDVIYTDAELLWNDNTILAMSLSKLGLPNTRVGIFLARPDIARAMTHVNAVLSLTSPGLGQALITRLAEEETLTTLCSQHIKPFYQEKAAFAGQVLRRALGDDLPYALHKYEGSFFFWLWLKDFPISTLELYHRLKQRNVIIVPQENIFPGLKDAAMWDHTQQCLRINFARPESEIQEGFTLLAEEIRCVWRENPAQPRCIPTKHRHTQCTTQWGDVEVIDVDRPDESTSPGELSHLSQSTRL